MITVILQSLQHAHCDNDADIKIIRNLFSPNLNPLSEFFFRHLVKL
jgi:hypothetical protein